MGNLNGIYGIISLFPAPTGSATEPTGILLMKLVMKATPAEDFLSKVNLLYNSRSRDPEHIRHINYCKFKTLNLFKNVTFLTLHVYRLKERSFQTSIFIALPIEAGKIDQNVDCCYIFSLNYGRYYIIVLYLTHKAQINDRSTGFVVERIQRDSDETCVFMAPAITGSFDTGSYGNRVQDENYHYHLALVYGDKTEKYFFIYIFFISVS